MAAAVVVYRALTWALPILVGIGCYVWWRRRSWTTSPEDARRGFERALLQIRGELDRVETEA